MVVVGGLVCGWWFGLWLVLWLVVGGLVWGWWFCLSLAAWFVDGGLVCGWWVFCGTCAVELLVCDVRLVRWRVGVLEADYWLLAQG